LVARLLSLSEYQTYPVTCNLSPGNEAHVLVEVQQRALNLHCENPVRHLALALVDGGFRVLELFLVECLREVSIAAKRLSFLLDF
jgi:hypothetical protein